jgi:hypothetical protein
MYSLCRHECRLVRVQGKTGLDELFQGLYTHTELVGDV